jgi:hypothetical protein
MSILRQLSRRLASKTISKNIFASYGSLINRNCAPIANVRNVAHLEIQKRFESNGALKALSDCFKSEIAGEEESRPGPDYLKMVKEMEKSFTIIDEPGKGAMNKGTRARNDQISTNSTNYFLCQLLFRFRHYEERAQK